jgi:FMN phosphatase YigB (HAD superfamily)
MVGNSLERDIAGALNAKLAAAIWIQVPGSEELADVKPHYVIRGLHEIPAIVSALA